MKSLRGPNAIRSIKQAIEWKNERPSRTEVLEDEPHKQALEQFLPQIAAESEQAAKPVRTAFLYYRRRRTGRRCSCFSIETSPDAACSICYGSGIVGGWDLHGCWSEWIDVTSENLKLINIKADYEAGIRPVHFSLENGTLKGFIETDIRLMRNIQKTQAIQYLVGNKRQGSSVTPLIKTAADLDFVPLTDESLNARLGENKITLRVEIERQHTMLPSPRLSHVLLRYQLIPEVLMYADVNLSEETQELASLGYFDIVSMLTLYIPPSFDHITSEDFLVRLSDQKRFKVTRLERNAISGILLSHKAFARLLIPGTDPLLTFP